jgi:hypothetical protein
MDLTLTLTELTGAFAAYNKAVWPLQWVAYGLGVLALALLVWRPPWVGRGLCSLLALFWLSAGLGFTAGYFGPIYTPAYVFAVLLTAQGLLLLMAAVGQPVRFRPQRDRRTAVGLFLMAYALAGFPLVGLAAGRVYPETIPFGITPCPVTVFTLGLYLMADGPLPRRLLVIPALWVLGSVVPVSLGVWEDLGLGLLGATALLLLLLEHKPAPTVVSPKQS